MGENVKLKTGRGIGMKKQPLAKHEGTPNPSMRTPSKRRIAMTQISLNFQQVASSIVFD